MNLLKGIKKIHSALQILINLSKLGAILGTFTFIPNLHLLLKLLLYSKDFVLAGV